MFRRQSAQPPPQERSKPNSETEAPHLRTFRGVGPAILAAEQLDLAALLLLDHEAQPQLHLGHRVELDRLPRHVERVRHDRQRSVTARLEVEAGLLEDAVRVTGA